jgi:hypothetical protein
MRHKIKLKINLELLLLKPLQGFLVKNKSNSKIPSHPPALKGAAAQFKGKNLKPLHIKPHPAFFLFLIPVAILACIFPSEENWQLKRSRNEIKVFSKAVEGTNFKRLRAETTIHQPLEQILKTIHNVENYPQWVFRCTQARILKRISSTEFYYYQVISVPWPISDRDMIIHLKTIEKADGSILITLQGVPGYMPPEDDFVRVQVFEGKWELNPLRDGGVEVIQELMVVTGGPLPAWMVNRAAVEGPYGTMKGLREIHSLSATN